MPRPLAIFTCAKFIWGRRVIHSICPKGESHGLEGGTNRDAPPLAKVAQARDNIRFLVQSLVNPSGNLCDNTPISPCTPPPFAAPQLTTRVCGYFPQKFLRPSGDAIYSGMPSVKLMFGHAIPSAGRECHNCCACPATNPGPSVPSGHV